ncbi:MAG: MoaD/ThiS family protein [Candidatus Bathyarchaeia archaeon]
MRIILKFVSPLQELSGIKEDQIEFLTNSITIKELISVMNARYSKKFMDYIFDEKTGNFKSHIVVMKNGVNIKSLNDIETKLDDGDVVHFFPPVCGGIELQ